MPHAFPRLLRLLLALLLASVAERARAQSHADILEAIRDLDHPPNRRDAATRMQILEQARDTEAVRRAAARGWPRRVILANGTVRELVEVNARGPVYFTTHNANAAISTGANLLQAAPFNLSGSGVTVGEWDGGSARSTHQELTDRINVSDGAGVDDHASHVAGTIVGSGVQLAARGMAPAAQIDSYDFNSDKSEMTARGAAYPGEPGKIYLSNHSYGYISGWNYTGGVSPAWDWWGSGTTATGLEDDFGKYQTYSRDTDALAASLPYYLIFRSAGNDRGDNPPVGASVALTPNGQNSVAYNPATHPAGDAVYKAGGYDTIGFDAVAKNVITIGAVADAVNGQLRSPAQAGMTSFSSWGPTDDGRIKPDIVANGENLYSSTGASNTAYATFSGTSMSTPNATGSAALLVDYFDQLFPGHAMRASTLKGILIHTADDLGTPGPDYQNGWGLMNVKAAADHLQAFRTNPGTRGVVEDRVTATRAAVAHSFTWDGSSPIRATLCWTDPAGPATTTPESRTSRLVNNLNLQIIGPDGTIYSPYVMPYVGDWTPAKLSEAAVPGVNNTDNVEQVLIAAPGGNGVYQARVTFSGALTNGAQSFSLLLSGGIPNESAPAPTLSSISPSVASSGPTIVSLTGANLLLGATLKFTRAGSADVIASGVQIFGEGMTARINVSTMAPGSWNVVLINPDGQTFTLPAAFIVPAPVWLDMLETGAAGWTHSAPVGTDGWTLTTAQSNSPSHSFFAPGPSSRTENILGSPPINVPPGATALQFSFWHNYTFQNGLDGGIVEFSVNGGAFFGINDSGSGASFASGGYSGTLASGGNPSNRNPLAGFSAWTGNSSGWRQVIISLNDTAKYAGKTLRARWRLGTNNSTASAGWYVDDFALSGAAIGNLPPSITSPAAAVPNVVAGTTTQLTVGATDDDGEPALTYTWSVDEDFTAPISFSENGTNAAKNTTATFAKAGTFLFTVTARDAQGLVATSSVNVQVDQTLTALTVAPPTATLNLGQSQQFTASGLDQFARPIAAPPSVTWGASGGGTINATGLFTAGQLAGGPFAITATSGAISGQTEVTVINKAPIASNDAFSGNEDTVIQGNVLTNDTDPDGNPLTSILVVAPAHGTLILNPNGSFSFTPTLNFSGETSFTYKANDGMADSAVATVTLTIDPVNDAPLATNDSFSGNEDTAIVGNVLTNDSDVEAAPLTASLVAPPPNGMFALNPNGTFTYTPPSNFFGETSFTYQANDGMADSALTTVTLTFDPVNDAPLATNDSFGGNEDTAIAGNVLTNDSDVEGAPLTATLVAPPANGIFSLHPNGAFTYTPASDFFGEASFTYKVNDGIADSAIATVTITVAPVNDVAVAANDAFIGSQNTAIIGNVLGNDADIDSAVLSAVLVDAPAHGILVLEPNGAFTYTSNPTFTGGDSFTYRANDGAGDSNVATVVLTITGQGYPAWQAQHFSLAEIEAGLADENRDPDFDRLVNLVEYATGTNPRIPNSGPAAIVEPDALGDSRLTFIYTRPRALPGVSYGIEVSSDLMTWAPLPVAVVTLLENAETVVTRDVKTVSEEPRRFMRLRVNRTPP